MSVFVYSLIAWIVISVFAILPKKLPLTENLCVYFCCAILMTSTFTTLTMNLQLLVNSNRLDFYFCREIGRYIIYPVLLLVFTNIFFTVKLAVMRWGAAILTFAALCSVHFLFRFIGDLTFIRWNSLFSMVMFLFFMCAAWLFEKAFAFRYLKEEG
ncbi:hypothetical protein DVH26_22030 [Paenibacillus sp. H1-7]|nr:hypothetical protein DVH26_22030 [Paenibacillus sp. H1-7]